jgi:glucokinase
MKKNTATGKYWIGFDLGGTKMMAVLFGPDFKRINSLKMKTKSQSGAKSGLNKIVGLINDLLVENKIKAKELAGIGMACPGPLDLVKGIILEMPNLGWENVKIKALLEKTFKCPAFIMNDVDAGVYGEYKFGAAKGARCVVGVFPGTGIGGGCVYDGKLVTGSRNSCMEIGHCVVMPNGPLCGCGNRGCLEALASRLAISSAAAAAVYRGEAPNLLAISGMDLSEIKSSSLAKSIKAGDKVIEAIVVDAAKWLGVGIGTLVNLMLPDVVVLGGGLVEAMPGLYRREVTASAKSHCMHSFRDKFEVVTAKLGDDATAMGSAGYAHSMVVAGKAGL